MTSKLFCLAGNSVYSVFTAVILGLSVMAAGCGNGGEFATSPVRGVVTYDGKPVFEGTIDFIPIPGTGEKMMGKPSSTNLTTDGTFTAGTYRTSDGVVPGKKRVVYNAPMPEDTRDTTKAKVSPFTGFVIEPSEVEITNGKNDLVFTLKNPKL